jgi:hypothetical protein
MNWCAPLSRACIRAYATLARYPGLTAPATQVHYDDAVKIAQDVVSWAEPLVP